MKTARFICAAMMFVAALHFVVAIATVGLHQGAGSDVFFTGYFGNPWQAVINVDLMAGLTLAACWLVWREPDRGAGIAWAIVLLYWGNLVLAAYLFRELGRSKGDWAYVALGRHAPGFAAVPRAAAPAAQRLAALAAALAVVALTLWLCVRAEWAPFPVMGYVWGLGGFIPALLCLARPAASGR